MNISQIEIKAMTRILMLYFLMAFVGIACYLFSNSEAILIDGIFNLISAFSMIIGIRIAKLINLKPTKTLPFGFAMYETLYTLFKGFMILGVLVLAGVSNFMKIYDYITVGNIEQVKGSIIIYYSISMVVICTLSFLYITSQSKKAQHQSTMLKTEKVAVFQNAIISAAIGLIFLLIGVLKNTFLAPLIPVADSIIVIFLCLILFNGPVKILKNSFNELIIKDIHHEMREKVTQLLQPVIVNSYELNNISISRLGRTYYFMISINPLKQNLTFGEIENIQKAIKRIIKCEVQYSFTDIIFSSQNSL
ncbi:MAG: cation transporter [Bacteroidales bacterium]|nr:cation transporter [Bacteroidales bacterium]